MITRYRNLDFIIKIRRSKTGKKPEYPAVEGESLSVVYECLSVFRTSLQIIS